MKIENNMKKKYIAPSISKIEIENDYLLKGSGNEIEIIDSIPEDGNEDMLSKENATAGTIFLWDSLEEEMEE